MTTEDTRRRVLLAMVSATTVPDAAAMRAFSDEDWQAIGRMARQHRLVPLLHDLLADRGSDWPVPDSLRQQWATLHRQAVLRVLEVQQTLRRACRVLAAQGQAHAALKGAWLAFHCYDQPVHRPMADVDLLMLPEGALAAFAALEQAGFVRRSKGAQQALENALVHDKHLPPLALHGGRVPMELHTRVVHDPPDARLAGTIADSAALLARTQNFDLGGVQVPCLSPTDALLHQVVHAVCDHHLDHGPLVLLDIAVILRKCAIDWPRYLAMAELGGWQRGSELLLQLTQAYHGDLPIPTEALGQSLDAAMLDAAALLLLVDKRHAGDLQFRADLHGDGSLGGKLAFLWQRAVPQRHVLASFAKVPANTWQVWLHYPAWLLDRSQRRLLEDRNRGDQNRLLALEQWLRG